MDVGIRDLRNNLSRYLDEVKAGAELTVTDRGAAIAKIVPTGPSKLDLLIAEGVVTPASRPKTRPKRRVPTRGSVVDLIADQRR